jgi:hypothetical protein
MVRLLAPVVRRLAVTAAARWLARAAAATGAALLAWALLTAFVPVPFPLMRMLPWIAAGLAAGAAGAVRWYRPALLAAARVADGRASLEDRLGTAVDLLGRPGTPAPLARLQIADALAAATRLDARAVAPLRMPREGAPALAVCLALAAWAWLGQGLAVPGTPAGRMAATIHREGRTLVDIGRRLDATARAAQLPASRRTAPAVQESGRRLEEPRVGWDEAMAQIRDVVRQLQAAQDEVRRRIDEAMTAGRAARPATGPPGAPQGRPQPAQIEAARLALEDLANALQSGSGRGLTNQELARRLGALSDSLDQLGGPPATRRAVDRARRAAQSGQRGAASAALGEAIQDLQGLERMLGDEQALGDTKRQVQQSGERIARAAGGSGTARSSDSPGRDTSPSAASGPNPVSPGGEEATPPPPGPNQGSLPGQGTGGRLGAPTPRLGGTRSQSRLQGLPGTGTTQVREIVGPGRAAPAQQPAAQPPADVAHEIDRALGQDPLPPAYLTLVRKYFETGGTP